MEQRSLQMEDFVQLFRVRALLTLTSASRSTASRLPRENCSPNLNIIRPSVFSIYRRLRGIVLRVRVILQVRWKPQTDLCTVYFTVASLG